MTAARPCRGPATRFFGRTLAGFDGASCLYCGRAMAHRPFNGPAQPTRDHFVLLARGGADAPDNVLVCCHGCNDLKGDLLATEWLALLERDGDPRAARLALILDLLPPLRRRCEAVAAAEVGMLLELA